MKVLLLNLLPDLARSALYKACRVVVVHGLETKQMRTFHLFVTFSCDIFHQCVCVPSKTLQILGLGGVLEVCGECYNIG